MKKYKINNSIGKVMVLSLTVVCAALTGCAGNATSGGTINPAKYIELGQYKGLNVEKAVHEVTEEEIQDELNTLASAYAVEENVTEGKIALGDIANIDYEGKLDGVAFAGGTAAGYDLEIGSGTFIPGFEDGLIGVEIGETVDLPLTFPQNYGKSELAGQDVIFTVKVNSVVRKTIPDITDDLIKDISNGQYDNLDTYKEALEKQIISEYEEYNELQYYEDLLNAAIDNATVISDIPNDFLNSKVSRMILNAQEYAKSYGLSYEDFLSQQMGMTKDEFNKNSVEYAQKAAKESLVIRAIAAAENITISEEEMNKAIDEYVTLGQYASVDDFKKANNMDDFEEYLLTSKVQDFLAENAQK